MNDSLVQKRLKTLNILYIEDEKDIRENLTKTLELIFNGVSSYEDAESAMISYNENTPDLILSDINLPKMSGLEFSKKLRDIDRNIPIILLTAHTQTEMLLEAVKLHLVSYLTKPVVFDELYDSFKIALKDILENKESILFLENNIQYDIDKKLASLDDNEIRLTASEIRFLDILIEKKSKTVSMQEIKNRLWDDTDYATDTAFKSVLNKLRNKIGKDSIKNISGIGYYLNLQQ